MTTNLDFTYPNFSEASELNLEYRAYPENGIDINTISGLPGSNKYSSAVVFGDLVFLVPGNANHIAIIDTVRKTIDTTTIPAPAGVSKWGGAIRAWNNKAFLAPFNFLAVGILDLVNLTLDTTTLPWSPAPLNSLYSGGYLAPNNGNIYFVPSSAQTGPIVIDPSIPQIINVLPAALLEATEQFKSAVLSSYNGLGYAIPSNNPVVGIINSFNDTWDLITITGLPGPTKWSSGAEGLDQKIYCPAYSSNSTLIIDPKTNTVDTTTIVGNTGYYGATLMPNKDIYIVPLTADNVMIVNTTTQTVDTTTISGLGAGVKFGGGSVCSLQGELIGIPSDATYVPIIKTGFPSVSLDYCTTIYSNKW